MTRPASAGPTRRPTARGRAPALVLLSLLLSAIGLLNQATALAAAPKVAVEPFTGPTADDVRGAVLRVLAARPEVELLATSALIEAARSIGADPDDEEGRSRALDELEAAAVVRGAVVRSQGRWAARVEVVHRATGRVAERLSVTSSELRGLDDRLADRLWAGLGPVLARAPPPRRTRTVGLIEVRGPEGGLRQLRDALSRAPWLRIREGVPPGGVTPDALARLARSEGLDGFLGLDLRRSRRRWRARVEVVGPDGQSAKTVEVEARRTRRLAASLLEPLATALDAVAPPPPQAPNPPPPATQSAQRPRPQVEAVVERSRPSRAPPELPPLELAASFRVLGRNLSYNDDLFGGLRPYDLGGTPMVRLRAGWYPGAHVGRGPLGWVGLELEGDLAVGLASTDRAGRSFGSSAFSLLGALRGRLPLGEHELGLSVGGGLDSFTLDAADDGTDPDVPDTEYGFLRAGVDGRFQLIEALVLSAGLGWRQVLSVGELGAEDWFPNASAAGVDAQLGVGYALIEGFEVEAGAELRRYFASFEPEPGDFPVAGGAIDQRWSIALGLRWRMN